MLTLNKLKQHRKSLPSKFSKNLLDNSKKRNYFLMTATCFHEKIAIQSQIRIRRHPPPQAPACKNHFLMQHIYTID